ncbi:hypothetical protein BDQ17DRAFT_1327496 [Cyathus striatus]|nr:hypothetical protein BDQ17DRAFT_1327496 [Cyathus striatus]
MHESTHYFHSLQAVQMNQNMRKRSWWTLEEIELYYWLTLFIKPVELFMDAEDFFTTIQSSFIASAMVEINGTYHVEDHNDIVDKECVQIVAKEIWQVTGYRFIVHDHKHLKSGHCTCYWLAVVQSGWRMFQET